MTRVSTTGRRAWKRFEGHADRIDEWGRMRMPATQVIVDIGKELATAQAKFDQFGLDAFYPWCRERLQLEDSTVDQYLRIYKEFGECLNVEKFHFPALFLLAKNDTPKQAIDKCLALANKKNKFISGQKAQKIIDAIQEKRAAVWAELFNNEDEKRTISKKQKRLKREKRKKRSKRGE